MPRPGKTDQRGYGRLHQQYRATLAPVVDAGLAECWRCGRPIGAGERWHLGHDDHDRSRYRGPEHVLCNLRAAAAKAFGRNRVRKVSRAW